ncbi:hypothetical protein TNIN_361111 [Trichonephila inaurata madagascariensis]|uniref:Uncharacterized protein n=1 Tax=Trichonephila inaurata madagascariensis TaxID=2747483 RepID=A0A8X6XKD2_9ARAC|nr:hypothetical protein TNIN_361111 [Trichonephila inaurata madagascariensis]
MRQRRKKKNYFVIDKHITEKEVKKVPSPTDETKRTSPVAEKVTELEIKEQAEKEAIVEGQKTKTPVDETKAESKEKQPSLLMDEHITKKKDKKISSPIEEMERISPVGKNN